MTAFALTGRLESTDSVEEPLQPNEGKERGDDDQYWAR
jgi:hypothetical protein